MFQDSSPPSLLQSRLFFRMPRVVPKQRERFEKEEIFRKNARDMEVRISSISIVYEKIFYM